MANFPEISSSRGSGAMPDRTRMAGASGVVAAGSANRPAAARHLDVPAGGKRVAHIAVFLDHLRGGGMQKIMLIIARGLAERGHRVDLVVCDARGSFHDQIAEAVNLVELRPVGAVRAGALALATDPGSSGALLTAALFSREISPTLRYLPDLVGYLDRVNPDAILSATPEMNIEASLARRGAKVKARLVVSEHVAVPQGHPMGRGWRGRTLASLLRRAYRHVDAVIAVSDGVAADLSARSGTPRERIITVYNPAVTPDLVEKAHEDLDHPWFAEGRPPVVLGVGRLGSAKDFPMLLRAFAKVRRVQEARLLILGNAKTPKKTEKRQAQLMAIAAELGVADDVSIPGFVPNPFKYMARSAVFALSSRYEGFGNVVAEALACGCPVVSTDCPSGPAEILGDGRFGRLVPVGEDAAMAEAILETIRRPPDPAVLRDRAQDFAVDRAVDAYEALLLGIPR
jgi:glycosyltransferase involved in cell wall biosynthesis